jgi:ketosteroid isomerase-like protein
MSSVGQGLSGEGAMNPEEVRDFAERYTAAWCSGDPAEVARHYAPEGSLTINDGTPSVGYEDITAAAKAFMDAFPDLTVLFDDLQAGPYGQEYHWTLDGTHSETGNHVRVSGYELWDLGDGVIRASRGYYNQQEYDRQASGGAGAG